MKDFELQVARAAVRLRDGENCNLRVKPSPRRPHRLPWGWIATPAAALAGIFIGVEIGRLYSTPMPTTVQVWDTIVERRVVYDTVTFVRQKEPVASLVSDREKSAEVPASVQADVMEGTDVGCTSLSDTLGKCILEDGVDYSLLCEALW